MDFVDLLMILSWTWEGPLWLFERIARGEIWVLVGIGVVGAGVGVFGLFAGFPVAAEVRCGVVAALAFWAAGRERARDREAEAAASTRRH